MELRLWPFLVPREEELLEELEERIESTVAKIDYNDQQIVSIARPVDGGADVSGPALAESSTDGDDGTLLVVGLLFFHPRRRVCLASEASPVHA